MHLVSITHLAEGMKLASDIIHQQTGVILLSQGVILSGNHITSLQKISSNGYCLVEIPSHMKLPPAYDQSHLQNNTDIVPVKSIKANQSSAQQTYQKVKQMYHDAYNKVKRVYSTPLYRTLYIDDLCQTAENITQKVARDPELLLQIAALKEFDDYTYSHAVSVAVYSSFLAKRESYSWEDIYHLTLAGLLHDLGKVEIPERVLNKPGPLSKAEWEIMKKHVEYGVERLKGVKGLKKEVLQAVAQHHEKVDGSGYPKGLSGKNIHPWARILAITDIYDAVTTNRVYRKGFLPHLGAELLMCHITELDLDNLRTFINEISFYPVGSLVKLNTGEICQVIHVTKGITLRPILQVLEPAEEASRLINLTDELSKVIVEVI